MEYIMTSIIVFLIGATLHFLHTIPHDNRKKHPLDIISAVNESTWEHMKIFINGAFIYTLVFGTVPSTAQPEIFLASAIATLISVLWIPVFYYGYKFILKRNILLFDIGVFLISSIIFTLILYPFEDYLIIQGFENALFAGILMWALILSLVVVWTYNPPDNFLFKCPVSKSLGHEDKKR